MDFVNRSQLKRCILALCWFTIVLVGCSPPETEPIMMEQVTQTTTGRSVEVASGQEIASGEMPESEEVQDSSTTSPSPYLTPIPPTETPTATSTVTPLPTETNSPTPSATPTPLSTPTNTPTSYPPTNTPMPVPSNTALPSPTVTTVSGGGIIAFGQPPDSLEHLNSCLTTIGPYVYRESDWGNPPVHYTQHWGDLEWVNPDTQTVKFVGGPEITVNNFHGVLLRYQSPQLNWSGSGTNWNVTGPPNNFSLAEVFSILRPGVGMMYIPESGYMNIVCNSTDPSQ